MAKRSKKIKSSSPKEEKLINNLLKVTQQFFCGKSYHPMTAQEIINRLGLLPQHSDRFYSILQHLIRQGLVEFSHQKYVWKQKQEIVAGTLSVHSRGFGFLRADDP